MTARTEQIFSVLARRGCAGGAQRVKNCGEYQPMNVMQQVIHNVLNSDANPHNPYTGRFIGRAAHRIASPKPMIAVRKRCVLCRKPYSLFGQQWRAAAGILAAGNISPRGQS